MSGPVSGPVISSKLPPSDSWKCLRCGTAISSPGEGRPPIACLESLGGCGRSSDEEENYTRFFPAPWGEAKVQLYIDAELDEGQRLFRDVVDVIRVHYHMEAPWHYVIAALWVLQGWVAVVLPVVFYLAVAGLRGTGKTNFLSLLAALTDALQYENVSPAAMAREMRFGRAVTMDELDVDRGKEANEIRDSLLRSGYKRNAAPYARYDAAKRVVERIPTFGPRAFGYQGKLEDALQDRGFTIPAVKPAGEAGYDFVRRNFWPEIGDLPVRLKAWGDHARLVFTEERQKEIVWTDAFLQKVKAAVQELGANRDSELASIALLVAQMAHVDAIEALKEAGKLREIESFASSELDIDDLQSATLEAAGPLQHGLLESAPTVRVRQLGVRRIFDERRKTRGDRHLSDGGFAKLRRELFRRLGGSDSWIGSHARANYWNLPLAALQALQALQTLPDSYGGKESQERQASLFTPEPEAPIANPVASPGEGIAVVTAVLRDLDLRPLGANRAEVLLLAEERGLAVARTESILLEMRHQGLIHDSPGHAGFLRLTEGL